MGARDLMRMYRDISLENPEDRIVERLLITRDWFVLKRLVIGAVILGLVVLLVLVSLATGDLERFYDWLVGWTTSNEPWTHIMRNNPWIYGIAAAGVLLGLFFLPRLAVARLYLIASVFTLGFLGGHILW